MSAHGWLAALIAGSGVGGGSYFLLTPGPLLGGALAVVYAAMGWLVVRNWSLLTDGTRGWDATRWSGGAVALSTFAALFGTHHGLSLPTATVFALQLLVVGVAWTMLLCGVGWAEAATAERTRDRDRETSLADG